MPAPQTQTLRMERIFDCTPDELWDAWTIAEEFACWISPLPDRDAEIIAFDPRPGGRVAWVMPCPAGEGIFEDCVFEVLRRPHELVIYQPHALEGHPLTGHPLTMRVHFQAEGDRTRLIVEHSGFPAHLSLDGAYTGFSTVLDKLSHTVTSRAPHKESR